MGVGVFSKDSETYKFMYNVHIVCSQIKSFPVAISSATIWIIKIKLEFMKGALRYDKINEISPQKKKEKLYHSTLFWWHSSFFFEYYLT